MRASRLLSILLLLQVHRRVTARDLARRLEVSERTILRDMDALSGAGFPVVSERGTGGGWSLLEGYQTKLTGLNAAEIQSLFVARPSRLMADLGLQVESEAALLKLKASLPASAREQAEFAGQRILIDTRGWRDPAESIGALPVLLEALWHGRRARFRYRKEEGDSGERLADPLGLVAKGSVWYLVAGIAGELRTYRVSRVSDVTILDEAASRPSGFDLAVYWERSANEFREKLPRFCATFLVSQEGVRWVRIRSWRVEEERSEGDLVRLRFRFDVEEEAAQMALSLADQAELIDPPELRARIYERACATVSRYRESGACGP